MLIQEFTNYHFDVKPNALYGALDRFAQFFIDPLCKDDALEREVMAVDNEFSGEHSKLGISEQPVCLPLPTATSDVFCMSQQHRRTGVRLHFCTPDVIHVCPVHHGPQNLV